MLRSFVCCWFSFSSSLLFSQRNWFWFEFRILFSFLHSNAAALCSMICASVQMLICRTNGSWKENRWVEKKKTARKFDDKLYELNRENYMMLTFCQFWRLIFSMHSTCVLHWNKFGFDQNFHFFVCYVCSVLRSMESL